MREWTEAVARFDAAMEKLEQAVGVSVETGGDLSAALTAARTEVRGLRRSATAEMALRVEALERLDDAMDALSDALADDEPSDGAPTSGSPSEPPPGSPPPVSA